MNLKMGEELFPVHNFGCCFLFAQKFYFFFFFFVDSNDVWLAIRDEYKITKMHWDRREESFEF